MKNDDIDLYGDDDMFTDLNQPVSSSPKRDPRFFTIERDCGFRKVMITRISSRKIALQSQSPVPNDREKKRTPPTPEPR
jgi:hypothetical protein